MKMKAYFLTAFLLGFSYFQFSYGQTFTMPSGIDVTASANTCSGTFLDNGGSSGNYSNNQKTKFIFCPDTPGEVVQATFNSFNIEAGFDSLVIVDRDNYTGQSFTEPNIIGVFWGTQISPGTSFTSTHSSGCLTFYFSSDGSINSSGWEATTNCVPPCPSDPEIYCNGVDENCNGLADDVPTVTMPAGIDVTSTINTCCGDFVDNGGSGGNYSNNQKTKYIICPNTSGEVVQATFNSFNIEAGFDSLVIVDRDDYTGQSFTEPNIIGVFWGTQISPGTSFTSTHSSGCLTFYFSSDGSINSSGWEATISCVSCTAPVAKCQPATVQLTESGNATLQPAQVDGGSTAGCGLESIKVSPSTFSCSDVGTPQSVTLMVEDINGNTSSCLTTVTVEDNLPPDPVCQVSEVFLKPDGTYTLLDTDVLDFNASKDNCGFVEVTEIFPALVDCDDVDMQIPLAVTVSDGNGNTAACTALITVLKGTALPAPWQNSDIDQVDGSAGYDPCEEVFTLTSSGYSSFTGDEQHFAYQQICGDAEIIAHVKNVNSPGWAGIQIRETLDPAARMAGIKTQLSTFIRRVVRTSPGSSAANQILFRPGHTWLRLVRKGSSFTGYTSVDGNNWSFSFFATIPMSDCAFVGLFSESYNDLAVTTAEFGQVSISGNMGNLALDDQPDLAIAIGQKGEMQPAKLAVFPNPFSERTSILLDLPERVQASLSLFNLQGQQVGVLASGQLDAGRHLFDWDGADVGGQELANGLYLLKLHTGKTVLTRKILLQR